MAGVNKVILIGNLGADPETRQTQSGPVCNLRVATTERWTDRDGQKQERTEWHSVTVWGRQAENCQRYLAKGRPVYIEGRLQSRTYTDQEGKERRVWDIRAQVVQFLSGGEGGGGGGGGGGWGNQGGGGGFDDGPGFDDDDPIPF
ncbi:MAG: single-stranded DNA-binding protein [Myxococcales bacterium]|nr:single-stranded DNA-binding protein [Myxococcales bacterium]